MSDRSGPREWQCRRCGHCEWVTIRRGGSIADGLQLSSAPGGGVEITGTKESLWENATVKLARRVCPRCGQYDVRTVRAAVAKTLAVGLLMPLVTLAYVVPYVLASPLHALAPWLFLTTPAIAAGMLYYRWTVEWRLAPGDLVIDEERTKRK